MENSVAAKQNRKIKAIPRTGARYKFFLLVIFINIVIPKCGIKIAGIPITLGTVLYAILLLKLLPELLKIKFNGYAKVFAIAVLYFILRSVLSLCLGWGFSDFVTYISCLAIYPFIGILVPFIVKTKEQILGVQKIITVGVIIIVVYAFLQFIFGIEKVCIPGITVNFSDYKEWGAQWYLQKYNGYGDGAKIVSTYQNGNVFGVSLIVLSSFSYAYLRKEKSFRIQILFLMLVSIVCLLTLSRTVWFGLAIMLFVVYIKTPAKTHNGVIAKVLLLLIGFVTVVVVCYISENLYYRIASLFSIEVFQLGGRTPIVIDFINSVKDNPLFYPVSVIGVQSIVEYSSLMFEISYITVFTLYGILGVVLFLFMLLYPIKVIRRCGGRIFDYFPIVVFCFMALLDGCMWLPPTSFNLFLIIGLLMQNVKVKSALSFEDKKRRVILAGGSEDLTP